MDKNTENIFIYPGIIQDKTQIAQKPYQDKEITAIFTNRTLRPPTYNLCAVANKRNDITLQIAPAKQHLTYIGMVILLKHKN